MGTRAEKMLNAALEYREKGFSIIPVGKNKKPLVPWTPYQKKRADNKQIIRWWNESPGANIGIVTGNISGLTVVDLDSPVAIATFNALGELPETPAATTPRGGRHVYFTYTDGLRTASNVLTKTDTRSDGGYIIAPPSQNGRGKYFWEQGRSILELSPAPMPVSIFNVFNNAFNRGIRGGVVTDNKRQQTTTFDNNLFSKGSRDESLFHVAYSLLKGGADEKFIMNTMLLLGRNCSPPFPEKEIFTKINSALQRAKNQERNLTQDIKEWILTTNGNFLTTDVYIGQHLTTREEKKKAVVILGRLVEEGLIERTGQKAGCYRLVDNDCPEIDFINVETTNLNIKLPLGLHDQAAISPNDLILFAGEANSGKSGLLYNIAKDNKEKFKIHWFSSEGGAAEFNKRLKNFDLPLDEWKTISYHERSGNFADVIKPGKGVINIIDYLELHDEFYKVGGILADIQRKLAGAIAIVALQKNPGVDVGLGGYRSLEKPRLAVAVSPGKIKIIKAKHWKTYENPNGLQRKFKLAAGCKLFPSGNWYREK